MFLIKSRKLKRRGPFGFDSAAAEENEGAKKKNKFGRKKNNNNARFGDSFIRKSKFKRYNNNTVSLTETLRKNRFR